jgi:cytochrome d ubiquinol oxidase subunit II
MPLEHWIAGAVMASLTLYALGGGADFGGGVWDLLARGPRAAAQRELIAHAIGPIWEANHVWLILAVVLMFVCFPSAWAALSTALHIPLTLMLIGVVLRGSAFAFRSYGSDDDAAQRRWGRTFAMASVVTPLTLGMCVGATASGAIRVRDGRLASGFFESWLRPLPLVVGLFTLALFAFLAAVYLTREAREEELRADFRRRALGAGIASGALAFLALALARTAAPPLWAGLMAGGWSLPFHALTALCALGALWALWTKSDALAQAAAIAQVALVLWGWAMAQFPFVIPPDVTFEAAAAPAAVLRAVLWALAAGLVVLAPSLFYLYRVFKLARS